MPGPEYALSGARPAGATDSPVRRVETVLGPVAVEAIGAVLFHEHVLFDFALPGTPSGDDAELGPERRWQVDYLSNRSAANVRQRDPQVAARELQALANDGGSLVVDQTVWGLKRDPVGLAEASRRSGVHVVAATGSYTNPYLSREIRSLDRSAMAERMTRELTEGTDDTGIRAGIIGEIGCSWPLDPVERRALEAAADAQRDTGAAISVHPGRDPSACGEILDVLVEAGADLERVVLCHMDRTYPDGEGVLPLLERGANVEWDFFGIEQSHYWMGDVELPTDLGRLRAIRRLAEAGFGSRILISQDVCTRTRMLRWGGHGYGHILRNVPRLMDRLEFDPRLREQLFRANPLRLLAKEGADHD